MNVDPPHKSTCICYHRSGGVPPTHVHVHVHVSSDSCIMIIGFCFPDNSQVVYQCLMNAVSLCPPESKSILFFLGA